MRRHRILCDHFFFYGGKGLVKIVGWEFSLKKKNASSQ